MDYSYDAFIFHQRPDQHGPEMALFLAPAGDVTAWSEVDRLGPDNKTAPQREPAKARVSSIVKYFQDDDRNTIPTAIVVGLTSYDAPGDGQARKLNISTGPEGALRPALIIDGQHRLRGMQEANPAMVIPIVAILGATDIEMAFQFLVINNKSMKVPRDHLRALALNYQEGDLKERLLTARLSLSENLATVGILDEAPESPFHGLVRWPNNEPENRIIVAAALAFHSLSRRRCYSALRRRCPKL